jgi:uncharacterized protein
MFAELDRLLEPEALAARGWHAEFEEPLQRWPRLDELHRAAAAELAASTVRGRAACHVRYDGVVVLEAELEATLAGVCQRCLEGMSLPLHATVRLAFGRAEPVAGANAEGFEHCDYEAGTTLRQVLEDELLLAVPAFPAHAATEACGTLAERLGELAPKEREQGSSPFAVLAELKRTD